MESPTLDSLARRWALERTVCCAEDVYVSPRQRAVWPVRACGRVCVGLLSGVWVITATEGELGGVFEWVSVACCGECECADEPSEHASGLRGVSRRSWLTRAAQCSAWRRSSEWGPCETGLCHVTRAGTGQSLLAPRGFASLFSLSSSLTYTQHTRATMAF